ncbi:MAG: hypothetical protein ACHQQQ_11850 [Bacteroidota bacterium]
MTSWYNYGEISMKEIATPDRCRDRNDGRRAGSEAISSSGGLDWNLSQT